MQLNNSLSSPIPYTTSTAPGIGDRKGEKMSCYHPLVREEDETRWVTAKDGHRYHPAKIYSWDRLEDLDKKYNFKMKKWELIPCGKCIGCRLDNSRDWANRGYLESIYSKNNYFVTLTYDENHIVIPEELEFEGITYTETEEITWKGTLIPSHLKTFINTLRKIFEREYNHTDIRYVACGEYGGEGKRPHYHLILFNCPFPVESFYNPRINWEKNTYYQNEIIERAWTKGISNITEASWNTIAYVSRYITKKINGTNSELYYTIQGQDQKEFFRASNRPGIGFQYYEDNKKEIYEKDAILIKRGKKSIWEKPPEYFDKLFEKEEPEKFKEIKEKRRIDAINSLKNKDSTTSLDRLNQLLIEEETKKTKTIILKRNLEKEMQ